MKRRLISAIVGFVIGAIVGVVVMMRTYKSGIGDANTLYVGLAVGVVAAFLGAAFGPPTKIG